MFLLRDVHPSDLDGLMAVAEHLDTVNLPADRGILSDLIERSTGSFAGTLPVRDREFIFALFDGDRLIGTSMVHAQHGTRQAPHIFFEVFTDERYSQTLDRHFIHKVLRIGYNYDGPTEIGGLILLPEYRGHPLALGRWLSYVRFLYIALHRDVFRAEVLSELLPPLEADGTSLLWESVGRHFTGLTYQEADRVSKTNKEFIRSLFPSESLYATLMPNDVQALIGVVGPETRGVEKMLRRIGFQYNNRIDPFDGGPHFMARTDDISVVKSSRRAHVGRLTGEELRGPTGLVCRDGDGAHRFMCICTKYFPDEADILLTDEARAALRVAPGDEVGLMPSYQ